jgi:hypothetical protein
MKKVSPIIENAFSQLDESISLRSKSSKGLDDFMNEYERISQAHPWNDRVRIINNTMVELSPFGGEIHFSDIQAMYPNQGNASKVLQILTNLADKHNVTISGEAVAYVNDKKYVNKSSDLKKWYKKYGFKINGDEVRYEPSLNEKLQAFDDVVTWIRHFRKSANKKFYGKDRHKRWQMAVAAWMKKREKAGLLKVEDLNEVLDKPLKSRYNRKASQKQWEFYGPRAATYNFNTPTGKKFFVTFNPIYHDKHNMIEMAFHDENESIEDTGVVGSEAFKVFSSVIATTVKYVKEWDTNGGYIKPIDVIMFQVENDNKKRVKIYERMAKELAKRLKWEIPNLGNDGGTYRQFYIARPGYYDKELTESAQLKQIANTKWKSSKGGFIVVKQNNGSFTVYRNGMVISKGHKTIGGAKKTISAKLRVLKEYADKPIDLLPYGTATWTPHGNLDGTKKTWRDLAKSIVKKYVKDNNKKVKPETLEIRKDFNELMSGLAKNHGAKDWYDRHVERAKSIFGDWEPTFQRCLACTSANAGGPSNFKYGLKAILHMMNGGKFDTPQDFPGVMGQVRANLKRVSEGKLPTGYKLEKFARALEGDWSVATPDRWMRRFVFTNGSETVNHAQNEVLQLIFDAIGDKLGWSQSEAQAAAWVTIMEKDIGVHRVWDYAQFLEAQESEIRAEIAKIEKEQESLNEGRDAPVYHATRYDNLAPILRSNAIRSGADKHEVRGKSGLVGGVSLSRNLNFSKQWGQVVLELDQRKLAYRHEIIPFDFWAWQWTKKREDMPRDQSVNGSRHRFNGKFSGNKNHVNYEFEEFLVGEIKNLSKYIRKIYINLDDWYINVASTSESEGNGAKFILQWCKANNVEIDKVGKKQLEQIVSGYEAYKAKDQAEIQALYAELSKINEGRDAPLYHSTDLYGFINIVQDNMFGARSNHDKSKYTADRKDRSKSISGVSLSRSLQYIKDWAEITFELDQRKLAYKHEILPIDYWQQTDYKGKITGTRKGFKGQHTDRFNADFEFEEFVVGPIKNALNYVTSVIFSPRLPNYYIDFKSMVSVEIMEGVIETLQERGIKFVGKQYLDELLEKARNNIKLMQKEDLNEGRDAPLYHATGLSAANMILNDNTLWPATLHPKGKLKRSNANDDKERVNGISLTRSIQFAKDWGQVVFELDQRKLSYNFSFAPYDYYQWSTPNSISRRKEAEEFLLGEIKNFKSYVRKIHISFENLGMNTLAKPQIEDHYELSMALLEKADAAGIEIADRKTFLKKLEDMKAMFMKEDVLDEGRDASLFHGTKIHILMQDILPSNTLLDRTFHNKKRLMKQLKDYNYEQGVSLTRGFDFAARWGEAIIELDQTKLVYNHQLIPVDYFEKLTRGMRPPAGNEKEEFVIGPIKNLKKYIKAIYVDEPYMTSDGKKELKKWGAENNIPIKYYDKTQNPTYKKANLQEGRDAPLYHATDIYHLDNILKMNTLKDMTHHYLHAKKTKSTEPKKGVSLTRTLEMAKKWGNCFITLDQRKLAYNHEMRPIDYWIGYGDKKRTESEEFVIGPIENLDKYIISITLSVEKLLPRIRIGQISGDKLNTIQKVIDRAMQMGIPITNIAEYKKRLEEIKNRKVDWVTINEGRDAPLYHGTRLDRLLTILKDNYLEDYTPHQKLKLLKTPRSNKKQVGYDQSSVYGVSLTRDMNFASDWRSCFIELDQRKLAYKHEILPINFFNSPDSRYEHEEFVVGRIKNIKSYIKAIYFNRSNDMESRDEELKEKIKEIANKNSIPIKHFDSRFDVNKKVQIYEGRDASLFHATRSSSFEKILKTNTLMATSYQEPSKTLKLKHGFDKRSHKGVYEPPLRLGQKEEGQVGVSLTRSFQFAMNWGSVIIEIDQRKLAYKHEILPLHYWTAPKFSDINSDGRMLRTSSNEFEEFVLGEIKNVKSYIKSVTLNLEKMEGENWSIAMAIYFATVDGIPVYYAKNSAVKARKLITKDSYTNDPNFKDFVDFMKRGLEDRRDLHGWDITDRKIYRHFFDLFGWEVPEGEILDEGRDAPLYHATSPTTFLMIAKTNKLEAPTTHLPNKLLKIKLRKRTESDKKTGMQSYPQRYDETRDVYGISLTRSLEFAKGWNSVTMELDQRKIAYTHEILPIHYWSLGKFNPNTPHYNDPNEYEEFVTKPIKNLDKYIKKIHINFEKIYRNTLSSILLYAFEKKIPVIDYSGKIIDFDYLKKQSVVNSDIRLMIKYLKNLEDVKGMYVDDYDLEIDKKLDILKKFNQNLFTEDAPTTSVSGGGVAGIGNDPPVASKLFKKMKRKKKVNTTGE